MHLLLHDRRPTRSYRYNKCTNTAAARPSTCAARSTGRPRPSSCRSSPNGDVLVADSECGHPARPQRQRRAAPTRAQSFPDVPESSVRHRASTPTGNSFWTGDSILGRHLDGSTSPSGDVLQTDQHALRVALRPLGGQRDRGGAPPPTVVYRRTVDSLAVQPVSRATSRRPTPVSAVLTNSEHRHTDRQRAGHLHPQRLRIVHRQHRRHRTATCDITAGGAFEQLHPDGRLPG